MLLLFWSTSVLAAWCGDPATHWQHPGAQQEWLKSSASALHGSGHHHCGETISSVPLVGFVTTGNDDDESKDPTYLATNTISDLHASWITVAEAPPVVHGDPSSPPLYILFQKLLLAFDA